MKNLKWHTCAPNRIAREIVELSTEHADRPVYVFMRAGRIMLRMEFTTRDADHLVGTYDSSAEPMHIIHDVTEAAWSEINQRRRAA